MTTQKVSCSYQEIIDVETKKDNVSVIAIHTPTGSLPHKMMPGFWRQYQKVKYRGCSISLVPAARLPVDPSQVGYEAGTYDVDARDILNPILWHGCHGNDLGVILNQFINGPNNASTGPQSTLQNFNESAEIWQGVFGDSNNPDSLLEDLYYRALTDNTWSKAHPQRGFRKSGLHPLLYDLGVNMQMTPQSFPITIRPNVLINSNMGLGDALGSHSMIGTASSTTMVATNPFTGIDETGQVVGNDVITTFNMLTNNNGLQFTTNRLRGLGWLDTWVRKQPVGNVSTTVTGETLVPTRNEQAIGYSTLYTDNPTEMPLLYMGLILLPPAYRQKQWFRLVINHRWSFAKYRGRSLASTYEDLLGGYETYTPLPGGGPGRNVDEKGDGDDGLPDKSGGPVEDILG